MKEYMQCIIDYIEDHIERLISIEDIETHIGYSRYYLHKLFYIFTGYTIMNYVRRRKMEYALEDITSSTSSVLDIAIKYGYSSERSFRRVFSKTFHHSPSMMRNQSFVKSPKIELSHIGGIKMLQYLSEVTEVKVRESYLVGIQKISNNPEEQSIDFMDCFLIENKLHPFTKIGSDIGVSDQDTMKGFRGYAQYLSLPYEEYEKLNNDKIIKLVNKESKFLKLTIVDPFSNPFERIPMGWKKLVAYVKDNYEFNNDVSFPCFEEKIDMMDQTIMNLYIAVK